jgi:hypothetical protein
MLSIVKLNPRKADEGVLLDANIFIGLKEGGSKGKLSNKLFDLVEKNYFSQKPRFAFYTTNQVLKEIDTHNFPFEFQEFLNFITGIEVDGIDDIINSISNGASQTDKGLLQVLATNNNINTLVSNDRHVCEDAPDIIRAHYDKQIQVYYLWQFLKYASKDPREVVHSGLAEIENYLQAHGKLANGG